jgi:4-aminobutyrate aminotransferase/(S)-3-amino-2-methylpropionate transaminase
LNALTPGSFSKKSMFVNSGAEAVENGVKIARYYTGRPGVICFEQGFHGRTLLALSLTSKVKPYKFGFGPYASEIYRMPAPYCYRCSFGRNYPSCELACAKHLEDFFISNADAEHIAALIIEPVTGEGGFIVPPKDYFLQLYEICRKHGILFIMDEVQSGMGRTGKLFASEHFSVEPDIILMAKSLAAGLPLGSITGRTEIMDSPHIGGLGGTFSGNPVACRAALAVLDLIKEENLLERAQKLGEQMSATLTGCMEKFKIIGEVRGLGPMIGIELVKDRRTKKPAVDETKNIIASCREDGLLVISCGMYSNVVRVLAPLVISDDQLNRGLAILERAIQKVDQNL